MTRSDEGAGRRRRAVALAGHEGDLEGARPGWPIPTRACGPPPSAPSSGSVPSTPGPCPRALADPSPVVRRRACEAVALRPGDAGPSLLPSLAEEDATVVEVAAWASGERQPPEAGVVAALAALTTGHEDSARARGRRRRPRRHRRRRRPRRDPDGHHRQGDRAPACRAGPGPLRRRPGGRRAGPGPRRTGTGRCARRPKTSADGRPQRAGDEVVSASQRLHRARHPAGLTRTVRRRPHVAQNRGGSKGGVQPEHSTAARPQPTQWAGPATGSDGLGQHADRHAEVGQHLQVLVGRPAQGGQVVPDDEGVDARRSGPAPAARAA